MTPDLGFGLNLGPHADFIIAAYAIAVLVVALLVGWVAIDHQVQKRRLASLEARGIARRSD
ncbi:MAG: heme exporter protein CcmD, partial [Rhizobiales bacterium]|nr:heme exporter protein CcmD [Hyphomicrobiales bacterium]